MKRDLDHIEIPDEHEARERTWRVVASAFGEHESAPARGPRRLAPALAVAAVGAIVAAAAVTSPGRALVHSIRESIGVRHAKPALFSLPAGGRLLVTSDAGVWVVQADGSKRRLGAYREASWSPHGLYITATRRNALYALTPQGEERWSLPRPGVRSPRWAGSRRDTRIAYTSGDRLRVVAGDGVGDQSLGSAPDMPLAPLAWRPTTGKRTLAFALPTQDMVLVVDVDAHGEELWSHRVTHPRKLEWSSDGKRLLVVLERGLRVYDARGQLVARDDSSKGTTDADATFLPGTHRVATIRVHEGQSDVSLLDSGRLLFRGTGEFTQVVASPDGRRLLVAWPTADQWVFLSIGKGRIRAASNISEQFRSQGFPRVEGWAP